MLIIKSPPNYKSEREYICHLLFEQFLGIEYLLQYYEGSRYWSISTNNEICLIMPDVFFQTPNDKWLTPESLPVQPLIRLDPHSLGYNHNLLEHERELPVIFGDVDCFRKLHSPHNDTNDRVAYLPIDIFGSAFFMLSRYEEVVKKERDEHDRFPAWASLAFQEGFLDRPIVNEYLEILWTTINKLWPGLKRKKRVFQLQVSCDVDHAYQEGLKNFPKQIKHMGGDLIIRKSPKLACKSFINYFASKFNNFSYDPHYYYIEWVMDENEKVGNQVTFFLKSGKTHPVYDAPVYLNDQVVRKLIRRIYDRGHHIGLHPSYNTYKDKKQLRYEANILRNVLSEEGIKQKYLGSRQHFLRWDPLITPTFLEDAEINYDTTLTFADHAGFRCGICYEYPLYDLKNRKLLNLVEIPLIVMECSVGSKQYMNIGYGDKFINYIIKLKETIKHFEGTFTLLWHNSSFYSKNMELAYLTCIKS